MEEGMGGTNHVLGGTGEEHQPAEEHSLLPLLEAVVNGLQAIDARFGGDVGQGRLLTETRKVTF
jgi:hypothetical protein